jgi:hypothetical protein
MQISSMIPMLASSKDMSTSSLSLACLKLISLQWAWEYNLFYMHTESLRGENRQLFLARGYVGGLWSWLLWMHGRNYGEEEAEGRGN